MKSPRTIHRIQLLIKTCFIVVLTYIVILLSFLFLGKDLKQNITSLLHTTIGKISNSIYCSVSSSLSYSLNNNNVQTDELVYSSFYSSVIKYVETNGDQASTTSPATADKIVIHNDSEDTNEAITPPPSDQSLAASSDTIVSEDGSLSSYDNIFFENEYDAQTAFASHELSSSAKQTQAVNNSMINNLIKNMDRNYLINNFYRVNESAVIENDIWNVKKLLQKDLTLEKNDSKPQILIFHTHAHEAFADSKSGAQSDTVVGVGEELASILRDKYGYNVMHYSKQYNFNTAYNEALVDLNRIVKENPSIKIIIDLHRDGVSDSCKTHTVCTVDGKKMAQIMFFNGVSRNKKASLNYHTNSNLQTNLAFSLQMKLYAMKTFPEFTKKNFIKSFRYNMHVVGRYSLVEVGDNNNTVSEVKAAMTPLAEIIDHVLATPNEYVN
ncbi:MAG: stage II sporulation protein P [bacterium]|nr:stage II sporulation protein P [bacterium]